MEALNDYQWASVFRWWYSLIRNKYQETGGTNVRQFGELYAA